MQQKFKNKRRRPKNAEKENEDPDKSQECGNTPSEHDTLPEELSSDKSKEGDHSLHHCEPLQKKRKIQSTDELQDMDDAEYEKLLDEIQTESKKNRTTKVIRLRFCCI